MFGNENYRASRRARHFVGKPQRGFLKQENAADRCVGVPSNVETVPVPADEISGDRLAEDVRIWTLQQWRHVVAFIFGPHARLPSSCIGRAAAAARAVEVDA